MTEGLLVCDWCQGEYNGLWKLLGPVPYYEWWANGVRLCGE